MAAISTDLATAFFGLARRQAAAAGALRPRAPLLPLPCRRKPAALSKKPSKRKRNPSSRPLLPSPSRRLRPPPILSDSLATFDSLFAATAEAGASLDLATLLRSFCDAGASPADALTLFSHISSPDATYADLAVRALCSATRLDDACALLRRLSSSSSSAPVLPDAFTYNFLIRRLARFRPVSSIYAFNRRASPLLQHPTRPRHLHHPHRRRLPRAQPS